MASVGTHEAPLKILPQSSQEHEFTTNAQTPSLIHAAISFLAGCSLHSRIAIATTSVAVFYLFFGRLLFLVIGVLGGVILHAWWEESNPHPDWDRDNEAKRKRRELGVEIAQRLLGREGLSTAHSRTGDPSGSNPENSESDFSDLNPATAAALETMVDAVINDYVRWWYEPILPFEKAFPRACRISLVRFLSSAAAHLARKRPAELFLQFVMNSSSVMIVLLSELSVALGPSSPSGATVPQAIDGYLEEYPESGLASILSTEQQREKLSIMANELLKSFLDSKTYECEPVQVFLREIITGVVFESTLKACSASEYINDWIIHLLEEGEPELMNAIDAGLDSLEQVNTSHCELALSETLQNIEAPGIEATEKEPPVQRTSSNLAKPQLNGSEAVTGLGAGEDTAADIRIRSLDGTANSGEGLDERKSCDGDINGSFRTLPLEETFPVSDSDEKGRSCVLESHRLANREDFAVPQGSMDGCHVSKSSYGSDVLLPPGESATPATTATTKFHNASVSILEDDFSTEQIAMRSKPATEYLLQIELKGANLTGWMVARKYTDFESLHETLRRISVVSGATEFARQHSELPHWKNRTARDLRGLLEKYLRDALLHECLSECEGMKRFLEKSLATVSQPNSGTIRTGFPLRNSAVFESMGKGVLDVISTAPKGVAESSKAVFGGVSGLFASSTSGMKRPSPSRSRSGSRRMTSNSAKFGAYESSYHRANPSDLDGDGHWPSSDVAIQASNGVPLAHSTSLEGQDDSSCFQASETESLESRKPPLSIDLAPRMSSGSHVDEAEDDHLRDESCKEAASLDPDVYENGVPGSGNPRQTSETSNPTQEVKGPGTGWSSQLILSEEEAILVVELLFAVVNEIYSLSSAWKFRRRLLHAAKTFLLRPGNPNLEAIRQLIQDSIIKKNTTPEALASYIDLLRESCFPGEVNDKLPTVSTSTESDRSKQQARARSLLMANGMPPALVSCMGSNATGEALGRIFDSLQVESVARGFICALLLQALKVVVQ